MSLFWPVLTFTGSLFSLHLSRYLSPSTVSRYIDTHSFLKASYLLMPASPSKAVSSPFKCVSLPFTGDQGCFSFPFHAAQTPFLPEAFLHHHPYLWPHWGVLCSALIASVVIVLVPGQNHCSFLIWIYHQTVSFCRDWVGGFKGFFGSSAGKESAFNAGDPGSIPGLGSSPGEGISYPLQYS